MKIKIVNKIIPDSTNNIIVYNNITGRYITNMYKKQQLSLSNYFTRYPVIGEKIATAEGVVAIITPITVNDTSFLMPRILYIYIG